FWAEHGVSLPQVFYLKGLGDLSNLQSVADACANPQFKVLGLVVDKVDRIMHGMELGSSGMHNQVQQWAAGGFLSALIDLLLETGFAVFLTADHGNVESVGCGSPREGVTAEMRGERSRIYSDVVLRDTVASKFPNATVWKPIGLPDDFLPLLAPDRRAFVKQGDRTVAHGGITLEEVVVPFIQVLGETT
ncbi:MAG: PglZ domain-containing protein, partial [Bryobacteraceae bacterium]